MRNRLCRRIFPIKLFHFVDEKNLIFKKKRKLDFLAKDAFCGYLIIEFCYSNIFLTLLNRAKKVIICKSAGSCIKSNSKKIKKAAQGLQEMVRQISKYVFREGIKVVHLSFRTNINNQAFLLLKYLKLFNVVIGEIWDDVKCPHNGVRGRTMRRL